MKNVNSIFSCFSRMSNDEILEALVKCGFPYDGAWLMVESGVAQDYLDQLDCRDTQADRSIRGVSKGLRFEIFVRDRFKCQICGKSAKDGAVLELDHKHPVSKGGKSTKDNLWVLCFDCNRGKGSKEIPAQILTDCARMVAG